MDILVGEILEQRDGGVAGSLLSVIKALDWLVAEGATVVNMSFHSKENAVFSKVLDMVAAKGMIMVAAAGNRHTSIDMSFPAAHPKVLAVTAIDNFRNAAPQASRGDYIDFAAPGVNVQIATLNGTGRSSGTSYAAPYVTSVVALTLEGGAPRDVDAIRQLIAGNAIDLGVPGKDNIFGWGLPKVEAHCGQQQFSRR
ncbi:MAG: S8 family serine peptidase [Gammaproteobacteria bacterium]|nr:S8 family serine peptidase [Gammaproteobacteria bacterium]